MDKDKNSGSGGHIGLGGMVDKAADAVGGVVGMASAVLSGGSTHTFVENAAIGNRYEIEAARIALQRSNRDDIRGFAQRMIDDHTRLADEFIAAFRVGQVDTPPPAELDSRRAGMIEHLQRAPEGGFDSMYLDQQRVAHQETVTLFERYADSGDNPQLVEFARTSLPTLQEHLDMARAIGRSSS